MKMELPKIRDGVYCHKLVAETAKNLARAAYEHIAVRNNEFFAQNPSMEAFVAKTWPGFVEDARTTLVKMLSGSYPEELKQEIYQAIVLDNQLTRGRLERVASRQRTGQVPQLGLSQAGD